MFLSTSYVLEMLLMIDRYFHRVNYFSSQFGTSIDSFDWFGSVKRQHIGATHEAFRDKIHSATLWRAIDSCEGYHRGVTET